LNIVGVYNLPEEWKALEEGNPNFFGYSIKFQNTEFKNGKYLGKQMTGAEMRKRKEEEE
jgi:hypothetical protein